MTGGAIKYYSTIANLTPAITAWQAIGILSSSPAAAKGDTGATGSGTAHTIGEQYQGGIIFWVNADGQHGLIASKADQNAIQWYNGTYKKTGSTGGGIGAGAMNTTMIVATQIADNQTTNFAAKVATDYSVQNDGVTACTGAVAETCWGDWYLPSKFELRLLYNKKSSVNIGENFYWSSTENDSNEAWGKNFVADSTQQGSLDKNGTDAPT